VPRPIELTDESFCYLTTTGRRTGKPHTIEIWFAVDGDVVYLLSGGGDRADWVRNLMADPLVRLRIGTDEWNGTARVIHDEPTDAAPRQLLAAKYQDWRPGRPLSNWARTALVVAIDVA
jgi:deazaflavin-dependent oxidoreductase (nitroreductase family)